MENGGSLVRLFRTIVTAPFQAEHHTFLDQGLANTLLSVAFDDSFGRFPENEAFGTCHVT